jgi:filamentous hemagglutinin
VAGGTATLVGQSINLQGKAFEDALEASGEFGQRLHVNSKTFDFFDPVSGNATSAKTLELLTDPRLRNPKQIYSTLTRYIDQVVDYGGSSKNIDLKPELIKSKAVVIAVEGGGSKAQAAQIQRAVDYAKERGLPVQIITVKGKGQ